MKKDNMKGHAALKYSWCFNLWWVVQHWCGSIKMYRKSRIKMFKLLWEVKPCVLFPLLGAHKRSKAQRSITLTI